MKALANEESVSSPRWFTVADVELVGLPSVVGQRLGDPSRELVGTTIVGANKIQHGGELVVSVVAGESEMLPTRGWPFLPELWVQLRSRSAVAEETLPRTLAVHVDRRAPWRHVVWVTETAWAAGIAEIYLAFHAPTVVPPPPAHPFALEVERLHHKYEQANSEGRALSLEAPREASLFDRLFEPCPQAAAIWTRTVGMPWDDRWRIATDEIPRALMVCRCRPEPAAVKHFHWWESGRRGGVIDVAIPLALRAEGAKRLAIAAPSDEPWATSHQRILAAVASGGDSFLLMEEGTDPADRLQDTPEVDDRDVYGGLLGHQVGVIEPDSEVGAARRGRSSQGSRDADMDRIQQQLRRHFPSIRLCYDGVEGSEPRPSRTVEVTFEVGPGGKVNRARATGNDAVADCVTGLIRLIRFPSLTGGDYVKVRYPLVFQPESPL